MASKRKARKEKYKLLKEQHPRVPKAQVSIKRWKEQVKQELIAQVTKDLGARDPHELYPNGYWSPTINAYAQADAAATMELYRIYGKDRRLKKGRLKVLPNFYVMPLV